MDISTDNTNVRKNNAKMTAVEFLGVFISALSIVSFPIHWFIWFATGISYANTGEGQEYWFYTNYFPYILSMCITGIIIAFNESEKKKLSIKNNSSFSILMYIVMIAAIIFGGIVCFGNIEMPISDTIVIIFMYIFVIAIEYSSYNETSNESIK